MRLYFFLIITAVCMAFASGYIFFLTGGVNTATIEDIRLINQKKIIFQKSVSPKAIINFNSIYFSNQQMRLIDPIYVVKNFETKNISAFSTSNNCFTSLGNFLTRANIEKVLIWEEYRCNKRDSLPNFFFKDAPYIHPSGVSYAMLAFKLNKNNEQRRNEALSNLPYFHLTELKNLRRKIGELGGIYNILSTLNVDTLVSISKGQGTILTKNFLLAKISYSSLFSILEYRFYAREDLSHFFKDSPFVITNYKPGKQCFYIDGEICFDYNIKYIFKLANKSLLVITIFLFIMIGLILRLLITKIKNSRLEDERRKLALQILTHEFRTPIASLLLLVEKLNKNFENFDDQSSETILRISGEVYRMQRLIQTGQEYVQVLTNKKLINFNPVEIASVNEYFCDLFKPLVDQYGEDLKVAYLEEDGAICADPYWISICVKNLVRNAFLHGEAPVIISLELSKNCFMISIQDNGHPQFKTLDEMTGEFVKGNKSVGTGLGLNIVKKVITEIKGVLEFEQDPTIFRIKLKRK